MTDAPASTKAKTNRVHLGKAPRRPLCGAKGPRSQVTTSSVASEVNCPTCRKLDPVLALPRPEFPVRFFLGADPFIIGTTSRTESSFDVSECDWLDVIGTELLAVYDIDLNDMETLESLGIEPADLDEPNVEATWVPQATLRAASAIATALELDADTMKLVVMCNVMGSVTRLRFSMLADELTTAAVLSKVGTIEVELPPVEEEDDEDAGYYVVRCTTCDEGGEPLDMPFETPGQRASWASGHLDGNPDHELVFGRGIAAGQFVADA